MGIRELSVTWTHETNATLQPTVTFFKESQIQFSVQRYVNPDFFVIFLRRSKQTLEKPLPT
jgi:hypothetical protein